MSWRRNARPLTQHISIRLPHMPTTTTTLHHTLNNYTTPRWLWRGESMQTGKPACSAILRFSNISITLSPWPYLPRMSLLFASRRLAPLPASSGKETAVRVCRHLLSHQRHITAPALSHLRLHHHQDVELRAWGDARRTNATTPWITNRLLTTFEGRGGDFDAYVTTFCLSMMSMTCYDFPKEGMMRSWGDISGVWHLAAFTTCWRITGVLMAANMTMNNLNMKKSTYAWVSRGARPGVLTRYLPALWIDGLLDGMIGSHLSGISFIIFFHSSLRSRNVL